MDKTCSHDFYFDGEVIVCRKCRECYFPAHVSDALNALQKRVEELELQLRVACHVKADGSEEFDWAILGKVHELELLRASLDEAVKEIEGAQELQPRYAEGDDFCDGYKRGADYVVSILRAKGLTK